MAYLLYLRLFRGLYRLPENAKFKKLGINIKGLMTQEFAKIPIL